MKRLIIILFTVFFCFAVKAQLSTEETPYSWGKGGSGITISSVPQVKLPNLDMDAIHKEDLENENDEIIKPLRFGFPHEVNINLSNSGVWTKTSDGGRLWKLRIYSPDALSLNLLYDKFWLPDSAKFFIYSEDMKQHIGAFTSENNKGDNEKNIMGFATGFLYANSIVLEYYEPKGVKTSGIISIFKVVSGYRYLYDIFNEFNLRNNTTVLGCHNDVNCHSAYANEKNAVAHMVMGESACTGSLLNTTAGDNRPVFLSANHCFEGTPTNPSYWIFYWNYEAPCGGVVNADPNKSTSGSYLLARRADTDFLLLSLHENPAMNSNISLYYLGWDRTSTPATSGVGIHHPRTAQKKISFTNTIVNLSASFTIDGMTFPANSFWRADFYSGSTEKGSSGSPLLNQNNRVVGQALSSTIACPPFAATTYGRFDVSWSGGGTSSTRLSDWLDPIGTNPQFLNGVGCNINLNSRTYSADSYQSITGMHRVAGCSITMANTVINNGAVVRIHGQNSVILNPGFQALTGSNVRITAGLGVFASSKMIDNSEKKIASLYSLEKWSVESPEIESVDFTVFPNPNDGNFTVKINGKIQPYTIEIFNVFGGLVGSVNCNEEVVFINRTNLNMGIYLVKVTMNEKTAVQRIIVK